VDARRLYARPRRLGRLLPLPWPAMARVLARDQRARHVGADADEWVVPHVAADRGAGECALGGAHVALLLQQADGPQGPQGQRVHVWWHRPDVHVPVYCLVVLWRLPQRAARLRHPDLLLLGARVRRHHRQLGDHAAAELRGQRARDRQVCPRVEGRDE